MPGSGPQDLLDQVARHSVEEKGEEEEQQCEQQQLEQQPAVRVPQEVAGGLERIQEPDEARVGPTGAEEEQREHRERNAQGEGSEWQGAWPGGGLARRGSGQEGATLG